MTHILYPYTRHTYGLICKYIPRIDWVDIEGKIFPASSCHDITDTKSAMKGGMPHFNTTELPLMTYSKPTSLLYGSCITKIQLVFYDYSKSYYSLPNRRNNKIYNTMILPPVHKAKC